MDFRGRQGKLIQAMGEDSAFIQLSQPSAYRNSTTEHPYRQHSTLHYLTGFAEPETALVIAPYKPVGERTTLFVREKDAFEELWNGRRLGVEDAGRNLACDRALPQKTFWESLPDLLAGASRVYFELGANEATDRKFIEMLRVHKRRHGRKSGSGLLPVHDSEHLIGGLRLRKDSAEIESLRKAAQIAEVGFRKVMGCLTPGMTEKQVHGMLVGAFLENGADMESYNTIVAGGANACILHYTENDKPLNDGDLILIDAGAQYNYYISDVTRTFPVGRTFSPEQKALYEICFAAQKAALAECKPGSSLPRVHDAAVSVLTEGFIELGLIKESRDEALEKGLFRAFYPHGTSHWIGKDVHDVGPYMENGKHVVLEPGMYFSVEPGIYVGPTADVDAKWRGLGIRIEDDVLITSNGAEALTGSIPKDLRELEARM